VSSDMVSSTAAKETDDTLYIRGEPKIWVAATETFTAQVTTLSLLTVYIGWRRGSLSSERAGELLKNVRGLPGALQQLLDETADSRRSRRSTVKKTCTSSSAANSEAQSHKKGH